MYFTTIIFSFLVLAAVNVLLKTGQHSVELATLYHTVEQACRLCPGRVLSKSHNDAISLSIYSLT